MTARIVTDLLTPSQATPHAVSRLRTTRVARSSKPFLARGGPSGERCPGCRLLNSHCFCNVRPAIPVNAGMCLLMADVEALKPSNTGWLIADVVPDTFAFGWARTEVDPALLAVLVDPQWQPYVVFPGEDVGPDRVVTDSLLPEPVAAAVDLADPCRADDIHAASMAAETPARRPLFILLDGTWPEARRMFRKSPYLNRLPMLSLQPAQLSRYSLRRTLRDDHLCTSEIAALCLELAGEPHAAETLTAYLDVFTHHYLQAKNQQLVDLDGPAHQRLRGLRRQWPQP
ncbi:MAG: tRNA-uridine aminocarboxypropyltransferase [Polaromonas sp.]|nr:tRNA-uridine aminocarboxypropyltransferase [Polaromonas sp.]